MGLGIEIWDPGGFVIEKIGIGIWIWGFLIGDFGDWGFGIMGLGTGDPGGIWDWGIGDVGLGLRNCDWGFWD